MMITMLSVLLAGTVSLQTDTLRLSLDESIALALEQNPTLAAERADVRAARQAPLAATRAFLPAVRLDANGMRTTDPVAVFGLKLRQENFQAADLALDALNRPAAYSGFTASGGIEVPIFVPNGLFGFAAARRGVEARAVGLERAGEATAFMVAHAYWNVQLATMETEALAAAITAANAHAEEASAMQEQGLVTGLDARLARLRVAELEARRLASEANAANARSALSVLLGSDETQVLVLTDSLGQPANGNCDATGEDCDLNARADLVAARLAVEAAGLGVRAAVASNLPSVAAFGSLARYSNSSPFGGGSGDWTVGIGVTWTPFAALSGIADVRRARADRDAADARLDALQRQARSDVSNAVRNLAAAERRVEVATAAREEAGVAISQATLRYQTGVSPITELLDVEAASVTAELNLLAARRDFVVARAALDFAYGAFE